MKRNISKIEKIPLKKKSGFDNIFNKNSLSANYFNQKYNKNRISVILDFLDINEQLPLIKLNSIFSKIVIEKYSLPFKCILPLRQYKNNKNVIESKYLLKNMKNNYLIFDKLNEEKNLFFDFLSKIKYIKNLIQ